MNQYVQSAPSYYTPEQIAEENARFMNKVYTWMTMGLLITSLISYFVGTDEQLVMSIVTNKILFWGMIIAQFGLVIGLSAFIKKLSALTSTALFLAYAALTGVTFSTIFLAYTQDSIMSAFATTVVAFGGLSAFGYMTKKDLGPIGTFCTMGLFGLIGFYLISMFFPSLNTGIAYQVTGIAGLIIFAGLTAYDTQKIKSMNIIGNEGTEEDQKEAIFGALTLYLDFINLFLYILRFMGDRRR